MEKQSDYYLAPTQNNQEDQECYEDVENNNPQESYLQLETNDQNEIQDEEYTDIQDPLPVPQAKRLASGISAAKTPELKPRKSNIKEEEEDNVYQNYEGVAYRNVAGSKVKQTSSTNEPRYVSGPKKLLSVEESTYANTPPKSRDSRQAYEMEEKEKPQNIPQPELPQAAPTKPFQPRKSVRTRHLIVAAVIILVIIILLFFLGFIIGWFTKGKGVTDPSRASIEICTNMIGSSKFQSKSECANANFEIILHTSTDSEPDETIRSGLIQMTEMGMATRVAYTHQHKDNIWIYSDVLWFNPTGTGEMCAQLHMAANNEHVLGTGSSQGIEWTTVCTNGVVTKVTYAIGNGNDVIYSTYNSSTKWFVKQGTTKIIATDKEGEELSFDNKKTIGDYISNGHDVFVAYNYKDFPGRLAGFLSSAYCQNVYENISTTQALSLSYRSCSSPVCEFNYPYSIKDYILGNQAFTSDDTLNFFDSATNNWDMIRYTVESQSSRGHTLTNLNTTWYADECWQIIHENNKQDTLETLLNAVSLGHRVRVIITVNDNITEQFEPDLVIIRNNLLYGVHIWKVATEEHKRIVLDNNGLWEWSMIGTNGKYVKKHCSIGTQSCNSQTDSNYSTIKWAVDTTPWKPIYHNSINTVQSSCGDIATFIGAVESGKPVRYMISDLENNIKYIHQTHDLQIENENEIIVHSYNEALLQWKTDEELEFSANEVLIWRKMSSLGTVWQNMWLFGDVNTMSDNKYNYLEGNAYNLTWFIQNIKNTQS